MKIIDNNNELIDDEQKELIEQKKQFKRSVLESIARENQAEFFELIKDINYNEKFKFHRYAKATKSIYTKLMNDLIDNIDKLSPSHQTNLRNICLYENETLGEKFCAKTNNVEDLIELYMQKALRLSLNFDQRDIDKENLVNSLYDLLEKYKNDEEFMNPATYFNHYFELNCFLTEDRLNKNIAILKQLDDDAFLPTPENIVAYLVYHEKKDYLTYYLNKTDKPITIEEKQHQFITQHHVTIPVNKLYVKSPANKKNSMI